MKYWLEQECKDLSDLWLLDEHRSVHAYFGAMIKDMEKWINHPLYMSYSPVVIFERHEEEVAEMKNRGWNHKTPIDSTVVSDLQLRWKEMKMKRREVLDV